MILARKTTMTQKLPKKSNLFLWKIVATDYKNDTTQIIMMELIVHNNLRRNMTRT